MLRTKGLLAISTLAFTFAACGDSNSTGSNTSDEGKISSEMVSDSSAEIPNSSSVSADTTANTSSSLKDSASGTICPSSEGKIMYWCGGASVIDETARIQTGLDNGSLVSGYWFTRTDENEGGPSKLVWPEMDEDDLLYVIAECEGLCATYNFGKGSLNSMPHVGVGFYLAGLVVDEGSDDYENAPVDTVDASKLGGICFLYNSDRPIFVQLTFGEQTDSLMDGDFPYVAVPKSASDKEVCFAWKDFKQVGWSDVKISGAEAAKKAAGLMFRFEGNDGENGSFNIRYVTSNEEGISTPVGETAKPSMPGAGKSGD